MATPSPPSDRDAPSSVAHEEGRRRVQPSRHRGDERHSSPGHAHPCDRERQADLRAGRGCYCDGGDVSGIPRRSRRLRSLTRSNSAMATGRQGSARPPGCSAANWSFPTAMRFPTRQVFRTQLLHHRQVGGSCSSKSTSSGIRRSWPSR